MTAPCLDSLVSVAVSYIYWRRASIALVWTMDRHVITDPMAGCIIACKYNGYGMPFQVVLPGREDEGNNHLTLSRKPFKVTSIRMKPNH